MTQVMRIKMGDEEVKFMLTQNLLTRTSITTAFFLPNEAVVSLSYERNGKRIHCAMDEKGSVFILPQDFSNMQFIAESNRAPNRAPRSTPAGSRQQQSIDAELEALSLNSD